MQAARWASLSADAKADALRRALQVVEERERQNMQERHSRFQQIEGRLAQMEASIKQMESRLYQLEWTLRK